jgi:uncharacterized OsmC-like protein
MITVTYAGNDRLRIAVRGHEFFADQPVEDGGGDTAPTPTEIFVAGLAACVAFYAERFLRRHRLATDRLEITCDYDWAKNPHRVGEISLRVTAPGLPQAELAAFVRVIEHCTVHNTLMQPPLVQIQVDCPETLAA